MFGDRATRLMIYEDMHVLATQRDNALKDAEAADKRAEELTAEVALLALKVDQRDRENDDLRRVVSSLQGRLKEARKQTETVEVGPALSNGGASGVQPGSEAGDP